MTDEIFMDVPAVKKMAGKFGDMEDKLRQTSKTLQAAIQMLRATAFIGLIGNAAALKYLEQLKPQIDNYAMKCHEMSADLEASAAAYERGDAQGAARFH
jgi:uncharacterized protein YukE